MGDLDVLPMEVSTSFSMAASVPATISTSTGSAAPFSAAVMGPPPSRRGSYGHKRPSSGGLLREQQVAVGVDGDGEAGVHRDGGAELLDDRRAAHHVAGGEVGPVVGRCLDPVVEEDPAGSGTSPLDAAVLGGQGDDVGTADRPDPADPEVDPLDRLPRIGGEVIAVELPVGGVEGLRNCVTGLGVDD